METNAIYRNIEKLTVEVNELYPQYNIDSSIIELVTKIDYKRTCLKSDRNNSFEYLKYIIRLDAIKTIEVIRKHYPHVVNA